MNVVANPDLIDDREYAAPPALVFAMWTNAKHFARWFAPDGFDVSRCEIDARPGGILRFHHRAPTGEAVAIRGVFDEVVPPKRLAITFGFVDDDDRPAINAMMPDWPVGAHIVMTVELSPTARGTRMLVAQRVAEPELADSPPIRKHRELAGIGWRQTAARLASYLEGSASWAS